MVQDDISVKRCFAPDYDAGRSTLTCSLTARPVVHIKMTVNSLSTTASGKQSDVRPLLFSDRDLIRLIIPIIIEQGLAILVGMADTVMVARVGEAAISGVSLVDMINRLIIQTFAALATGGAVVISQFLGARKKEQASRASAQLISLSLILGMAITALCVLFRRPLLSFFFGSIDREVMDAALLYLLITALSFPFLALYNAGTAIFRSAGNSTVSMRVSLLMNFINVAGNAYCIFVLHMGVAGVAVPTLIARALGAVIILWLCRTPGAGISLSAADTLSLDLATSRRILHIGVPSGVENSLFQLGRVTVVSMISTFGTLHIAANAVANNIDQVSLTIGLSMGLAVITVVGRAVGAQDEHQVRLYMRKLVLWTYLGQGAVCLLILIFLPQILKIYGLSAETSALASVLIHIHLIGTILLWPTAFTLPNALRAANDVRFTMAVSVLSMLIFRVGLSYVFCVRMQMGAVGVWIAMLVDWVVRIIFFVWRWRSDIWKRYCILN